MSVNEVAVGRVCEARDGIKREREREVQMGWLPRGIPIKKRYEEQVLNMLK